MHINSSRNSTTSKLRLEFDAKAQAAFSKALPIVQATLHDPAVKKILELSGFVLPLRMEAGVQVLHSFTVKAARRAEIEMVDLHAVTEMVMFVANCRVETGKLVGTLPKVVLLLSKVTHYFLPCLPLPPAAEVFDRLEAESPFSKSYEYIRRESAIGQPSLTLMQMYELWLVLRQNHQANAQLNTLEKCLEAATRLMRQCLQSLAAVDLLISKIRAERNGSE